MASETRKKVDKIYNQIDKLAQKGKDYKFEYYKLIDEIVDRGDFAYLEQSLLYNYEIDITTYSNNTVLIKQNTWDKILLRTNNTFQQKLKKLYDTKKVYQQSFYVYSDSIASVGLSMSLPLTSTFSVSSSTQSISPTRINNNIFFSTNDNEVYKYEIYKCDWSSNGLPITRTVELFQEILVGTQSSYKTELATSHGRDYLVKTYRRGGEYDYKIINYRFQVTVDPFLGTIEEIDALSSDTKYYVQNKLFASIIGLKKTFLQVTRADGTTLLVNNVYNGVSEQNTLLRRYQLALDFLLS